MHVLMRLVKPVIHSFIMWLRRAQRNGSDCACSEQQKRHRLKRRNDDDSGRAYDVDDYDNCAGNDDDNEVNCACDDDITVTATMTVGDFTFWLKTFASA